MTNAEKIYEDARVQDLTLQDVTDKICELYELDGVFIDPHRYTFKKEYSILEYATKQDAMEQFLVDTAHLHVKIVHLWDLVRYGYPVYCFTVEFHIIGGKNA